MRSFWISLCVFILLMCSCKSSKVDSHVQIRDEVQSETSYMNESIKVDSTKAIYIEQISSNRVIKETITTEEYDKDTGALTKKTQTEREIRQDSDKVVAAEEEQGMSVSNNDSLNHIVDKNEMVEHDTKTKEEVITFHFWKWLGITVGVILGLIILFLYLKRKSRIS